MNSTTKRTDFKTPGAVRNLPLAQRIHLHGALVETTILPSCTNCINGIPKPNGSRAVDVFCEKAKAFPPLQVIVTGCELWDEDIPF